MAAFSDSENKTVAGLAAALLDQQSSPPTLSLVAEDEGKLVGHVAFSPVVIEGVSELNGYILAPLSVVPDRQKSGMGSKLVEMGIDMLRLQSVDILFVYGDPSYYGRFGFDAKLAETFPPVYSLEFPFGWQAMQLSDRDLAVCAGKLRCVGALDDPAMW